MNRRALLATMACALLVSGAIRAQDPRASVVQAAAREWLALADNADAEASWNAAGSRFRDKIPLPRWAEGLKRERDLRGAVLQRAVMATSFGAMPGLPDSDSYAMVRFRTSFANESLGTEDITLELGPDNVWRVIGYVLR